MSKSNYELHVKIDADGYKHYRIIKNFASPDDIVWNYASFDSAVEALREFLLGDELAEGVCSMFEDNDE